MLRRTFHYFLQISIHLRSLILMFLGLIAAGGVVLSVLENLAFWDAMYFAFITGLTIGYGDIAPATGMGRVVAVVLGLVGILFTGLVVAMATNSVRRAWDETHPDQ